jgi:Holliday junction DNA helicase RuvA
VIASVRGEVLVRRPNHVVVEAGGVGYRLAVSAETLKAVPSRGKQATLHAHLVARDDSLSLYGFASEEERDLFLHLTSVSGIGPKVAVAILSGGPPRELLRAIAAGDAKRFQSAPGVGKRTAERLIVELREKVAGELTEGIPAAGDSEDAEPRSLARDGLMHLGYTLTEAEELLDGTEGSSAEELINAALRRAADGSRARR